MKTLIIGASGFIGSYLLKELESNNESVRVMARTPSKVITHSEQTEVLKGDLDDPESIKAALSGIETIYYLAHSMSDDESDFKKREISQANNIANLLTEDQKIIYLGGIIPNVELSEHLESRASVGEVFGKSHARAIEFRASIVIGTGSASYEMIRALVSRLPFIVTAKWATSHCQPIALENVLTYLISARDQDFTENQVFNIGGKEITTYKDLILKYAKFKELRRPEVYIEEFPVELAKEVMKIIIPEYAKISGHLIGSIELETIVTDSRANDHFDIQLLDIEQSFEKATLETLKDMPIKEILSQLKNHNEIPQYFKGQSLQVRFSTPESFTIEGLINSINEVMPKKFKTKSNEEIFIKIPLIGEFNITHSIDSHELIVFYKPKYFFQSMGWILFSELIKKIEKLRT